MLILLLLLMMCTVGANGQTTPLDCSFLSDSFQYTDGDNKIQNYSGECCTSEAVNYLNERSTVWKTGTLTKGTIVTRLHQLNYCEETTTSLTTTIPTTTTTEFLDCFWLDTPFYSYTTTKTFYYNGNCCTADSLEYLNQNYNGKWQVPANNNVKAVYVNFLIKEGICEEPTTTKPASTSTPSTSTTPISTTTTTALQCGPLADTSCCTPEIAACLTSKYGAYWLAYGSTSGYETELAACGCVLTTTSTSTEISTVSSNINCSWLSAPFNYTVTQVFPSYQFSYHGTCCSQISVDTLESNNLAWLLNDNQIEYNKWYWLTMLLYCTEGACTDPPLWTNCSLSSTSSSSSRSTQTTTEKSTTEGTTQTGQSSTLTTSTESTTPTTTITASTTESITTAASPTIKFTGSTGISSSQSTSSTDTSKSSDSTTTGSTSSSSISTSTISTTQPSESTSTASTTTSTTATTATGTASTSSETTSRSTSESTTSETTASLFSTITSSIASTLSTIYSTMTTPTTATITTPSTSSVSTSASASSTTGSSTTSSVGTTQSTTSTASTTQTTSETPTTSSTTVSKTTATENTSTGTTTNVDGVYFRNTTVQLFANCTQVTEVTTFYTDLSVVKNVTVDLNACSSTSPMTTTSPEATTTYNWPTGGTTRTLPSGEIIISESLIAYKNCTTVLMQLIYNPSTNTTRTQIETDPDGCKVTSSSSPGTTTPTTTPTTPMATTESSTVKTTTYNWPKGTTRELPSGEIILSETLIAYQNCTTVLMQLIYNPSTNQTRTETTSDEYGCKASSSTVSSSKTSTTPMKTTTKTSTKTSTTTAKPTTPSTSVKTTTYNWPTGGTTKVLPSGEIILSESLIAYKNCTTVLMQLIYNPSTNQTRTETTSDVNGCKVSSSTSPKTTTPSSTVKTSTTSATTTFNWPTGGTTKVMPSGEIILSESLIAYKNCTTVLMQLIFNPATNTTRTETTSDEYGCKVTSTTASPSSTATPSAQTTTYNWPTGGTTRLLPSGEIILSESLIAYKNCTTVLLQLLYNPSTNSTRTETTSDVQGCKATSSSASVSYLTTPMPSDTTTTFEWPTGGTTRTLPSGEIIISEALIAYKNCTTVLNQLIYNPATNTTRTETTADVNGCKATSSSIPPTATSPIATTSPTEMPFTFPESKTTQILPSGEIILSEALTAYPNCTTTLRQLIYNPTTNTTRTETVSDSQGCKATTTSKTPTTTPIPATTPPPTTTIPPGYCAALKLNMMNTLRPDFNEVKGMYATGEKVIHLCKKRYMFEIALQPLKIYVCKADGTWAGKPEKCVLSRKTEL